MAHVHFDRAPPRRGLSMGELVGRGLVGGFAGGALMMGAALVRSAVTGQGRWLPARLVAGVFFGVDALIGGAKVILFGVATHFIVAVALGVLFSLLAWRVRSPLAGLALGLAFGVVVWGFMSWLVLPWANPDMLVRVAADGPWWFALHLLFGIGVGLAPVFRRQPRRAPAARRAVTAPPPHPVV